MVVSTISGPLVGRNSFKETLGGFILRRSKKSWSRYSAKLSEARGENQVMDSDFGILSWDLS
jgi:hypothetical protein